MRLVERPRSWYAPDELSQDEVWVEDRVEELTEQLEESLPNEWLTDYIDWERVTALFTEQAEQELDELKSEKAIADWEDHQDYLEWKYG